MHCPSCGNKAQADQRFCRSCGFSLVEVSRLLIGQPSARESDKDWFERGLLKSGFWGIIGFLGIITSMLGDKVFTKFDPTVGLVIEVLGWGISAVGLGILFYILMRSFWLKAYRAARCRRGSAQSSALPKVTATTMLPPDQPSITVPSVTEQTTQRLETPEHQPSDQDLERQVE